MTWGSRGVTKERITTFQSPAVTVGATSQLVPFNPVTNLGILRKLRLSTPYKAQTITTATNALITPTALQMPQLNIINRFRLQMSGAVPVYDVSGVGLGWLAYVGSGRRPQDRRNNGRRVGYVDTGANYPAPWSFPSSLAPVGMTAKKSVPLIEYDHAGPIFNIGYSIDIPLTEFFKIPGIVALNAQTGQLAAGMGDAEIEMGLMIMQSSTQSVTAFVELSSLYGPNYYSVLLNGASPSDTLSAAQTWNMEHTYYDLPPLPTDMPPAVMTGVSITRQQRSVPVNNGVVEYDYQRAGNLLRSIHGFFSDAPVASVSNTAVDVFADATQTPDLITCILQEGSTTQYINETAQANLERSLERYGEAPPGILIYDLIYDGTMTGAINSSKSTNLRLNLSGLPSSITRMEVVEERLIPVMVPNLA